MQVFITGATGVLGHRLVERLADRGHEVYGLARDESGAELVRRRGGTPQHGDVLDVESLESAVDDIDLDIVVHAATAIPTSKKPTEAGWARNDRVRHAGAKNLVTVVGDRIDRFVFPSVVWVARQPDGSRFDETADRNPDRTTESAAAVEAYLEASEHGFKHTILRCGFLYAPDAAHTRQWGRDLLAGDMPVVGGGLLGRRDATLTFLHADDAALAFADAIDTGATGLYHVVDDEPVTVAELLSTFATYLDAPTPSRVPGWLARLFVGNAVVTQLTTSMPTTNEKFTSETGWEPTYATYRDGLQQVVETWRRDGTLRDTGAGYEWTGSE